MQEIRNSKKVTNGPQGTLASKTAKPVYLVEKGLNKLRINLAEVKPTHKIEPEVCLTLQVESQHFKNAFCTGLEYARDLGNTMHESLKCTSQWSACYFTERHSYHPLPENSISLRDIPKEMSQADQTEWAQQRTVRQCNTKHNAGNLPLNVYEKELPLGRESNL